MDGMVCMHTDAETQRLRPMNSSKLSTVAKHRGGHVGINGKVAGGVSVATREPAGLSS
jgi:hypothetical protein